MGRRDGRERREKARRKRRVRVWVEGRKRCREGLGERNACDV